jgi:predicted nucleic acid-binding protein
MGGMRAVFDTNILIDYLNGYEEAFRELENYSDLLVSRITWMEILAGASGPTEDRVAREFLWIFRIVEISPGVAEKAVHLRRERRLRLPDAIVLASAHENGCLIVTRDTTDFHTDWPEVRVPYQLP